MQTTVNKDPYQLVCQAFQRDELKELLLGEKDYGYKMDFRNDYTSPEEKTDVIRIYETLVKYYLANNKNPLIPFKITNALMGIAETHWGIRMLSTIINSEALERSNKSPYLNLDLDQLASHLKNIIKNNRAALMQEKLYGGLSFDQGMYVSLTRASARCVEEGGPAFIEDNPSAGDRFEATTTFTLTLTNKLANLTEELNLIPLRPFKTILKGSPISQDDGYIAAQDSSWIYTIERQTQPTGETQFICMVNHLYSRRVKLLKLIEKYDLETQVHNTIWLEQPDQRIAIPATALQKISEMNIPFSIEIQFKL